MIATDNDIERMMELSERIRFRVRNRYDTSIRAGLLRPEFLAEEADRIVSLYCSHELCRALGELRGLRTP